jgi:lipopolysaccharide export system permease protein
MLSIIVPKSQEFARSLFKTSDVDYFEGLIKPKKFNDTIKGLTIYAEEKKDDGELKNIYIKKTSDPVKFQITFSKKGIFETRGNSKILVLYDGQTLSNNNGKLSNFNFSKSDFGLADMSSHTVLQTKIQEQSSNDIIKCLQILLNEKKSKIINCNLQNIRNIYKETFKRFVTPLYIPLLILTSLLLLLSSKESIKYSKYKILVYTVGFITIVLSEASLGYLNENILVNLGLMILPIFLTIV